jgi:hypothetical protein
MKFSSSFKVSTKHVKIDKANQKVVIAIAIAVSLSVFSAISVYALTGKLKYQQLVLDKRNQANKQLEKNYKEAQSLFTMYQTFENTPESMIGTPDKNSKIVLDALPSKYDFPATAVYFDKLIVDSRVTSDGFTGQDQEATALQISENPEPVAVPIAMQGTGDLNSVRQFIENMYRSVRPVKISTISISGSDKTMTISVTGNTYYQPQKDYNVQYEVIKPANSKSKNKSNDVKKTSNETSKNEVGAKK